MLRVGNELSCRVIGIVKTFSKNLSTKTMDSPLVTIKQGKLCGTVNELYDGSLYYSFKGIPYAQPPVGKLRFKAPLGARAWRGVRCAGAHGAVCPQVDLLTGQYIEGSEDCLFLNVYTKSLRPGAKAPVMVFIHGGAYMSGSGDADLYGAKFLLQHEVTLVTINYRLEFLGFLCLDTPEVPGNAGIKDQVAALRWVRDNIEQFGGDPDNVTIFGESAGAASVTYHLLSPMSAGLFHRAIAQSGVCISDWAQGTCGKERAVRAARSLGKDSDDPDELLDFFQSLPVDKFPRITFQSMTDEERRRGLPIHFAPVVERRFPGGEAFLDARPMDLLLAGAVNKVPLLAGYNSSEGLMIAKSQAKKIPFLSQNPSNFVPRQIAQTVPPDLLLEFGDSVREFYAVTSAAEGAEGTEETEPEWLVDINSDVHFVYDCHRFCRLYGAAERRLHMYRFDCDTELNAFKRLLGYARRRGACHADDLFYLFDNAMNRESYAARRGLRAAVRALTATWTHFARFGELPAAVPGPALCGLRAARGLAAGGPERARVAFWNQLYRRAGLPAITTSNL